MSPSRKSADPQCAECGEPFTATNARVALQQKYCSPKCKMAGYWRRRIQREAAVPKERRRGERRGKKDAA